MSMTSTFLDHSQSRSHFPLTLFSHCPTFIRSFKQIKITNNTHTHTNDAICGQKAVDIHIFAIPSIRWPFVRILSSNFLTPNIFIFLLFSLTHFWPVFFCSTHSFGHTVSVSFSLSFVQTTFLVCFLIIHNRASIHFAYIVRIFFFSSYTYSVCRT